eukprot:CAMPEP_0113663072 /NCGR_PEP_ID=MMETSP0038_2-20120614/931_1 /TAXON_ID=2898 /ORGANISM="Cryptomonas paramecium" /LENGTH=139 /DNA_ID=CAMNT_0000578043 /DNA_START=477 /DNA_END=896 /DNA_ORIENTATION=- /assembly_acc=CAM_ASM_000170
MTKLGVIVLQLFKQDTPEVQNMVGFLAFIVFLVQSRIFAPINFEGRPLSVAAETGAEGSAPTPEPESNPVQSGGHSQFLEFGRSMGPLPHFLLLVYLLGIVRWAYHSVHKVSAVLLRRWTLVVSRSPSAGPSVAGAGGS